MLCVDAYQKMQDERHDHHVWLMYHVAVLTRWAGKKPFPDIKKFLSETLKKEVNKKPVKGLDEGAIMVWLKAAKEHHNAKAQK